MSQSVLTRSYPETSRATLALVLGILGVLGLWLVAPFAWWLGSQEKNAIDSGRRDPANRGQAVAGRVLGIIGTLALVLIIVLVVASVAIPVFLSARAGG